MLNEYDSENTSLLLWRDHASHRASGEQDRGPLQANQTNKSK